MRTTRLSGVTVQQNVYRPPILPPRTKGVWALDLNSCQKKDIPESPPFSGVGPSDFHDDVTTHRSISFMDRRPNLIRGTLQIVQVNR